MVSLNFSKSDNAAEEYLSILGDKLVQESSLPDDKYHLGKMILKVFKEYPNRIMQIDKGTGESENIKSFHDRTVRAALAMRARGLHTGDVVAVLGPNHLDLAVPLIACLYVGIFAFPIDKTWKYADLDAALQVTRPKIIFCQNARADDFQKVMTASGIDCEIVTFDENNSGYETIRDFLQSIKHENDINSFEPANFNTSDTTALMLSTSGSTGPSKSVCITHEAFVHQIGLIMSILRYMGEDRSCALLSTAQWTSGANILLCSCLFAFTRIQISDEEFTVKQVMEMIHDFKPKWCILTPYLASMIMSSSERNNYDFTSLNVVLIVGAHVTLEFLKDIEKLTKGRVYNGYGLTETSGNAFGLTDHCMGSCGTPAPGFEYKIVSMDSGIENGPNVPGELWLKGPVLFKEYYGKPEKTKEAFSEDGFLKTGDLFYKDENDYYFFIDRIKMMLKYKMFHVSPVEIENLIKQHPGVKEVAVIGVTHSLYGDLPTACVVRTGPDSVNEDEIHELVKKNLVPSKYLRGGVLFMDKLMMTSTYKIDRKKLRMFAEESIDLSTLKMVE